MQMKGGHYIRKHKCDIDIFSVVFLIIIPTLIVFSIFFLCFIEDYNDYKHPEQVEYVDTVYTTSTGPVEIGHGRFECVPTKPDLIWEFIVVIIWTSITLAFSISIYKKLRV